MKIVGRSLAAGDRSDDSSRCRSQRGECCGCTNQRGRVPSVSNGGICSFFFFWVKTLISCSFDVEIMIFLVLFLGKKGAFFDGGSIEKRGIWWSSEDQLDGSWQCFGRWDSLWSAHGVGRAFGNWQNTSKLLNLLVWCAGKFRIEQCKTRVKINCKLWCHGIVKWN